MQNNTISDLFVYPIKSSTGLNISAATVLETGFEFDRYFGVLNAQDEMLTARENSKLLTIVTKIKGDKLTLVHPEKKSLEINFKSIVDKATEITLFKKSTFGKLINNQTDNWFSEILEEPCRLVKIDAENLRKVNSETIQNGINFSDCFPIHIVTTASINDLNTKLETPITDNRFRPNIIISGTTPYEEENWKSISIGTCEFEVIMPTERCSLITIDPTTLEKSRQQEPLRTLAKNRKNNKKVTFGVYLIPKNSGTIYKTDKVSVTL